MSTKAPYLTILAIVLGLCGASWGQKKATNPNPANGTADVAMPLFRWTAGSTAMLHDVYIGKTRELGSADLVGARQPLAMFYYVAGWEPGVTYYWRVDEIEKDGVTIITGDVWTFITQALTAYYPDPADGATTVPPAVVLKWWPGRGATQHHVYFSDNRDAVSQAAAGADKGLLPLVETTFKPGSLQEATTYYWRVDELVSGAVQAGPVWTFTTWTTVDDFESYTDKEGSRIYETWLDGLTNSTGSLVGYMTAPFAEQTTIHGGLQSMPLDYNNLAKPFYSEAEQEFSPAQDWTAGGTEALVLYVQGKGVDFDVMNAATPPTIDGKADDVWAQATVQYIKTKVDGADLTGPADCSGQFRVLYDAVYLYVLVDVNDEALVQDSDPGQGWLDDRIEVFIDGDNSKDAAQDGKNDYQYCFRWNHGVVEVPVEWYRSPGSLAGVQYAVVTTGSGYRLEIKLPWATMIGGPARAGRLIGIDVMVDDDDDGADRDSQIAWYLTGGDPHRPNMWGTALLADAAAPPADRLYVTIQDSSNKTAMVVDPDAQILKATNWVEWKIPLSSFTGVNLTKIKKLTLGVGDKANPAAGRKGVLYIDDISLVKP
jgi:hypothetical protein